MIRIILFLLFTVSLFSGVQAQKAKPGKKPVKQQEMVHRSPSDPAQFPGCEDVQQYEMKISCAQSKLAEYVKANLKYPKSCLRDSIEGIAFVEFVIGKDGKISQISLNKKSKHPDMDKEAMRLIKSMGKQKVIWIPAKHNGKIVISQTVLPIKFKINRPVPPAVIEVDEPEEN